jgi:hypothetical protein
LGPVAVIELKDLVRAERSGVAQLFCFFFLEKDVIEVCVFCGDTNVRFLAIPVALFILLTVFIGAKRGVLFFFFFSFSFR